MTPIKFSDVVVKPVAPDRAAWEQAFAGAYLINHSHFWRDIEQQERRLEMFAADVGYGPDSRKMLEGLAAKVHVLRKWTGLQKIGGIVEEIKSELRADKLRRIAVFCEFTHTMNGIREGLRDFGAVQMFEGTPASKRAVIMRKFSTQRVARVGIFHFPGVNGAIDLSFLSDVFVAEPAWSAERNLAAIMRCWNAAQTQPVHVRFVGLNDSLDKHISQVLKAATRALARQHGAATEPDVFAE